MNRDEIIEAENKYTALMGKVNKRKTGNTNRKREIRAKINTDIKIGNAGISFRHYHEGMGLQGTLRINRGGMKWFPPGFVKPTGEASWEELIDFLKNNKA